ncbi:PREDICTED: uncharacterized protein LOC107347823 [Acropora digitifera]|uniref:uncharacterized protein LOC107347823 n=1 Tax=Acropora digitifera TaxID=70779 RepID=UPI00077AC5B1|nr:PREDICTED: uncharacterized protein LOC107347823 [Acropora digitifera]XP_015769283.1 PREDICTED: uncharacterized protein LOC107347823 [Acropora digitifera]XP_015769284.1 PREDICTED: uncharacterized protein LOC107347823 [Acropora digitifera]
MLNISGALSLKVKAGLVPVSGSGKYLRDNKKTEDTTEVLVVLKCLTVSETMRGLPKLADDVAGGKIKHGLGTHYARSITYGGELAASLSIKNTSSSKTLDIQGRASGAVNTIEVDVSLDAQLKKLTKECSALSDISIKYYSTDLPSKAPTNLNELVELIKGFPSRLEKINKGKGIPLEFELQPISTALQIEGPSISYLLPLKEDQLEQYYDDLRAAQTRLNLYQESNVDEDDEVSSFSDGIEEVIEKFMQAINSIGSSGGLDEMIKSCFDAYHKALGGGKRAGKFCRKWEQIISKKKPIPPTTNITLPRGDPLTVVLIGNTGNGKSSTGNQILGQKLFGVSDGVKSDTDSCTQQTRTKERKITVIDTPGVIDTKIVKQMTSMWSQAQYKAGFKKELESSLKELARLFLLAPGGFNAILLLVKFGSRFTRDDNDALQMLLKFFTPDAKKYMILVLSHGDQAEYNASEEGIAVDEYLKNWIGKMDDWLKTFIHDDLKDRVVLFNCRLKPDKEPEAYMKQLCKLIEMIDEINKEQKVPFKTKFTDDRVTDAAGSVAPGNLETLKTRLKSYNRRLNEEGITFFERQYIEKRKKEMEKELKEFERQINDVKRLIENKSGGCYPASATFVDVAGRRRQMESLLLGEEVQVITNKGVTSKPVITFIHRQPDLFQKFLQITTLRYKKILKITQDHLIFVDKNGKEAAIPARDVKIGDMVYVKVGGQEMLEKDAVQCVSIVFEKGVYAPVTLSGTILVNDVYTSCYFDVLSHVWFHRAMGAARAVYHLSPKMAEWISSIGEEDGFPGWCRLGHKLLLTWNDLS